VSRLSCVCVCTHNAAFAANRKALTRTTGTDGDGDPQRRVRGNRQAHEPRLRHAVRDQRPRYGTAILSFPSCCVALPPSQKKQKHPPLLPGHFYFTKLLIPVLTATAKDAPAGSVRVVNVSSLGHYLTPPEGIQWSTLKPGDDYLALGKKVGALKLYGQSKLVRKTKKTIVSSLDASRFSNLPRFIGQHPLLERTR